MGEGSRGLGKNQRGLRVGCCEMLGDYYDDSSVKENLNLLLRLTWVEANVDSKMTKGQGFLKGFFKGCVCWGLPQQVFSNNRLHKTYQGGYTRSVHSRIVRRLREIQGSREDRVDSS